MKNPSDELRAIRALPYGAARIAAAEAVARRIEAEGPREALPEALLDLVEAYSFTSDGVKSFVVFSRLLRLWDESPELFTAADTFNLFWESKWVASDLADYPQITADQATAFLDDMQRRFELAGNGLSAVRMVRFRWAWNVGSPTAEADRLAWVRGERDKFDDCKACVIGRQVHFFTQNGRHAEAVELGLTQRHSCNIEPAVTHHSVALSALLVGDPALALDQHRRALAAATAERMQLAPSRGQAFELLARGGHLDRALRALRTHDVALLREADSPLDHLQFLLGLLAGLSANLDHGDVETRLPDPAHHTVAHLHTSTVARVEDLAAQFDARNGNTYYADLAARALSATRTELPLDFTDGAAGGTHHPERDTAVSGPADRDVVGRDVPGADDAEHEAPTDAHAPTAPRDGREPAPGADALIARAALAATAKRYSAAIPDYLAAAAAFESAGLLAQAGAAYAEAAQCAAETQDDSAAHDHFAAGVARLVAGGCDESTVAAVLAAWAPLAVRMDDVTGILAVLAAARTRLTVMSHRPEPGRAEPDDPRGTARAGALATVRDTLARTLASTRVEQVPAELLDIDAADEAMTAGEEYARLGLVADAAHAFWLAGTLRREDGESEAAVWGLESAFEGFTVAGWRDERAQVAGELIALLRSTGQQERAEQITAELTR